MELHDAIRHAYAGRLRQIDLAAKLGVDQTAISRWSRGTSRPQLEEIAAIEAACDRPRGFVLRLAGFVDEVVDVATAVAVDPALSDQGRRIVLTTYRSVVEAGG
ncbi:MAG TPA: helix-turn-helix transcriptional regulator [Acidimicrobiales bacterium]